MKSHFYVYRAGSGRTVIKHPTLEAAVKEAERLAGQHPGESFEILQCVAITRPVAASTFYVDGVIPPHICDLNRLMDGACGICGNTPSTATIESQS
jgi:hypothetical protein